MPHDIAKTQFSGLTLAMPHAIGKTQLSGLTLPMTHAIGKTQLELTFISMPILIVDLRIGALELRKRALDAQR